MQTRMKRIKGAELYLIKKNTGTSLSKLKWENVNKSIDEIGKLVPVSAFIKTYVIIFLLSDQNIWYTYVLLLLLLFYCKTISGAKRNSSGYITVEFQGWEDTERVYSLKFLEFLLVAPWSDQSLIRLDFYLSCGLRKYNIKL